MLDLRRAIKDSGRTQKEVAESLGITLTSLNKIMSGNPTYNKMQEIAEVLGVDVVDLFYGEGKREKVFRCPFAEAGIEITVKEK